MYKPARPVYIRSWGTVVGKKETAGPLGSYFDLHDTTDLFGMDTFEKAESEMQRLALQTAMTKGGCTPDLLDLLLAGDLVNQCIASTYGLTAYGIPYLGLYGACSTAAEGLLLSAMLTGDQCKRCANVTSSHFCTAERQFRFPLEYGGQRPPTSQWTVTGAGAYIVTSEVADFTGFAGWTEPYAVQITGVLPGRQVDGGIKDGNNMGAAMAPAAMDTLLRYLEEGNSLTDVDMILTGDLGREGSGILCDLLWSHGVEISAIHTDCGKMIYRMEDEKSDVHAGASGCGCSAVVLAADILPSICRGELGRVLFLGTGALMNSMALFQGQTIPGIAHLVQLEKAEVPGRKEKQ